MMKSEFNKLVISLTLLMLLAGCGTGGSQRQNADAALAQKGADENTRLAISYFNRGDYEYALEKLNKALAFDPDYVEAHTVMATLYGQLNQQEKAGTHFKRAAELAPDQGETQNNYGIWLCRNGQSSNAYPYFDKALDDPFYNTPFVALTNSANCKLGENRLADAEIDLQKALAMQPRFADALIAMAEIRLREGNGLSARGFLQRYEAVAQVNGPMLALGYEIEQIAGNERAANRYLSTLQRQFPDYYDIYKTKVSEPE